MYETVPSFIKISLYNMKQAEPLAVEPDGHLGTAVSLGLITEEELEDADDEEGKVRFDSILLEVEVEPKHQVFGFNVTEQKDVVPSRDWRVKPQDDEDPAHDAPEGTRIFRRSISVTESELHIYPTTKFPGNNLRILEGLGNGYFQLWRVAVVSQNGNFFLVVEKLYKPFRCYRSGKTVLCPIYQANKDEGKIGWAALFTMLQRILKGEDFENLPEAHEVSTDPKPEPEAKPANGISANEGRVVWFSDAEQYGMLMTKQGPARAHWRNIRRPNNRRVHLVPGELVTFTELTEPHNTKGRDTGFKYEAVGIELKE